MINPTGKKLQNLISKMIDDEIEGIEKYTLNGSTWLIFTDQKKWVIEYTEDSILWYNYSFFTEIFEILSMKATDNQNLIQEWFESRFLRPEVNDTRHYRHNEKSMVEHTIENGVKDTSFVNPYFNQNVEHTIQNGVKRTVDYEKDIIDEVEDTIQNGVKHIDFPFGLGDEFAVEDAIQNGVKRTGNIINGWTKSAEDAIQNGVKRTLKCLHRKSLVEGTIQNGVKETKENWSESRYQVEDTIQNGVKEIKEISDSSLWSEIFKVKSKKTIRDGVKHTHKRLQQFPDNAEDAIQNGVKTVLFDNDYSETYIENTIKNGVKHTMSNPTKRTYYVDNAIKDGVKQTKPMDEWVNSLKIVGDVMDYGTIEMVGTGHATDDEMNDIIDNGVKEVRTDDGYVNHFRQNYKFDNVFENIVKEVQSDCSNNTERVNGVIRVGEKLN